MPYLMGIDNGGTFVKAGIVDEKGSLIAVAKEPVQNYFPKPGYVERDMDELWERNARVIRKALEVSRLEPEEIEGISFSGHGKGLYLLGEDKKPVYPGILSTDCRAAAYPERWKTDGTRELVFAKTYQEILPCQPVSLLAWMRDHHPDVLDKTSYICSAKDYIRCCLTGTVNAEYTDFSGANLVNLDNGSYDRELLNYFGLGFVYDKLPPLVQASCLCGGVTKEAALKTGLAEGTPVMAGMFDVDACGLASGLCDEEGMCMIAGTWSINQYIRRSPVMDGSVSLNSMYCIPGYYLMEESSPTSAGNMQWFLEQLMSGTDQKTVFEVANHMVEDIDPRDSNVVFLPFLNGSGEDARAKGAFIGLSESHHKGHMLRAVYEGVVFSHAAHVEKLLKSRTPPETIRLSGGASNSPVWVQMFADVLQIPVEVVDSQEQGIVGAAMAAGVGIGVFEDYADAGKHMVKVLRMVRPRAAYREVYLRKFQVYKAVVDHMGNVWQYF